MAILTYENFQQLRDVLVELHDKSDYELCIVGTAILDEHLGEYIKKKYPNANQDAIKAMLGDNGVLSRNANKINFASFTGIIHQEIIVNLKIVSNVRNKFSHRIRTSFDDPDISGRINKLTIVTVDDLKKLNIFKFDKDFYQYEGQPNLSVVDSHGFGVADFHLPNIATNRGRYLSAIILLFTSLIC
ncbi:hypothetical protein [Ancylobacter oerskovii]|uniref:Uncharacterized protein n=1 Tax=Ancylobacter oerskovii TaxID=459519 RepID=A0ABW4Z1N1_9HYPH|nr:hypothetical protein [Ancylobacter oerskovii]MBS7542540.1 hypothetical protein [Ancylobacter oerskovii]